MKVYQMNIFQLRKISSMNINDMKNWKQLASVFLLRSIVCRRGVTGAETGVQKGVLINIHKDPSRKM